MITRAKQLFISLIAASSVVFALVAVASLDDVVYPVQELGGCKNEKECLIYCDDRDNLGRVHACIDFAKKHELLSPEEFEEAQYYARTLGVTRGPGGCRNRAECNVYCENTLHLDECLDFAEQHSLRSAEEIAEGRKISKALREGASLPGGCKNKVECEAYCEDPSHMRECIDFAKKAGFISEEEMAEAEKIIPLLERGEKTPGNCGRKEACEAYCSEARHIDECLVFAEKAGLLAPDELADAKKVASFIKSGETPGGCKRRAECETYCSDPGHFEECLVFGEKAGIMSKEDVELARKIGGVGPGGCRSQTECDVFCRNPINEKDCLAFAKEHGLEEVSSKIQGEARAQAEGGVKACLEKQNCKEMIACFQEMAGRTGGKEGDLSEEARAKLNSCIAEITKELQQQGAGVESEKKSAVPHPEDQAPPSPDAAEEYQRQYQEEYTKQYDDTAKQYCHLFEAAPKCEYAAPQGSDNYNLCKKCFPEK